MKLFQKSVKNSSQFVVAVPLRSAMNRSRRTAAWLAIFLGGLGVHRFYLGRNASGFVLFALAFTAFPLLIGLWDAVRWLSMDDRAFAREYGESGVKLLQAGPLGIMAQTILLMAWKILCLTSWSLLPVALDLAGIPGGPIYLLGFGPLIAILFLTPWLASITANPILRYLLDPIGSEAAVRPYRTFRAFSGRRNRRRARRWHHEVHTDEGYHTEIDSVEMPAVNPTTGLPMSGPGTTGVDSEGNAWGSDMHDPFDHSR